MTWACVSYRPEMLHLMLCLLPRCVRPKDIRQVAPVAAVPARASDIVSPLATRSVPSSMMKRSSLWSCICIATPCRGRHHLWE